VGHRVHEGLTTAASGALDIPEVSQCANDRKQVIRGPGGGQRQTQGSPRTRFLSGDELEPAQQLERVRVPRARAVAAQSGREQTFCISVVPCSPQRASEGDVEAEPQPRLDAARASRPLPCRAKPTQLLGERCLRGE
jgi:hypothetical protein